MQDTVQVTLVWPSVNVRSVVVTGDFDNWAGTRQMHKSLFQGYTATLALPAPFSAAGFEYKFFVDGVWQTSRAAPTRVDPSGKYVNNFWVPEPEAGKEEKGDAQEPSKEEEEEEATPPAAKAAIEQAKAVAKETVATPITGAHITPAKKPSSMNA